jgi:perosamine synthetase
MLPRMRFDIGWSDIFYGMASCLTPRNRQALEQQVATRWSSRGDAMACLSVRSGFDLLLAALNLPRDSEILVSALTIKDMVRIIEEHHLVAVPLDVDVKRLMPTPESIRAAITPRTRAILVAHLFGTRVDLQPLVAVAREHGLVIIEDCAQAYVGPQFTGSEGVDVSMFSFGPIKTASALSGALLRVRDPKVLVDMRARQATYRVQDRWFFFRRLWKYGLLKIGSASLMYDLLIRIWRMRGIDHDALVSSFVRSFPGPDFFVRIRRQPSAPLLALLERRLKRFDAASLAQRTAQGQRMAKLLDGLVELPGAEADSHSYWVFPFVTEDPQPIIEALWREGFDATQGHSLIVVEPPADRPELEPHAAREARAKMISLPWFAHLPSRVVEQMAHIVRRELATRPRAVPAPTLAHANGHIAADASHVPAPAAGSVVTR